MWVSIHVRASTTVAELLDMLTKAVWQVVKGKARGSADQGWLLLRGAAEDFFMDTLREIGQTDGNKIILRFELFDERQGFEELLSAYMLEALGSVARVSAPLRVRARDAIRRTLARSSLRSERQVTRCGRA